MEDEQSTRSDAWAPWRSRISASRKRRDDLVGEWQENVDARRGKTAETDGSSARVYVNQDWPLTKAKIAQLYSQTPEVRLSPRDPMFQPAVQPFGRELNDTISDASVGTTLEEVLADVVNAAGVGADLTSCEKRTETRLDPMTGMEVPVPVDIQYLVQRISPADLLIPSDFTGSNYDHARWLGHDGRYTWAQAVAAFGLTEDVKEKVLGSDKRTSNTNHTLSTDSTKFRDSDVVNFTQIFYWRHYYHPEETSFKALQRLVFVEGLDEPVIDEPYAGQKRGPTGQMLGVVRNPIQVLTLTYISDDSLPPSDSSISRFQVDELEQSRDAMVQQRKHSIPIRWYDTNRIGAGTKSLLEKGTFQGFIPTNGPGDRAVGEVARASFPAEKFEFDRVIKADLSEIWQVGTNQAGAFATGERSASEARIIQSNFQTRVGQERDKVTRHFLAIAEILAGHLALYGTAALPDEIGIDRELLATGFTYTVRVDSTVRLDAAQRLEQLERALNLTVQSGFVNPKPIIQEIMELSGLDPSKVVIDPQPKPQEPVKISVSNAVDLRDPMFLGVLARTGQLPTPEDLSAGMKAAVTVNSMMPPPPSPEGEGGADPGGEVARPGISHADWETAPRIERRKEDGGA